MYLRGVGVGDTIFDNELGRECRGVGSKSSTHTSSYSHSQVSFWVDTPGTAHSTQRKSEEFMGDVLWMSRQDRVKRAAVAGSATFRLGFSMECPCREAVTCHAEASRQGGNGCLVSPPERWR